MAFDYSKLKGRIVEKFGTQGNFAKAMGWSERTLTLHMTGQIDWKQKDILKAMKLLDISELDVQPFFFAIKVQSIELA